MSATQTDEQTLAEAAADADEPKGQGPDGDPDFDPDEEGEGEPNPDNEPEPEAAAQTALSEKQIEKAMQALDAESARHAKRVAQIMGEDFATLLVCPLDFTPGYVMPFVGQEIAPEQKAAILALVGEGLPPELEQDPTTETCAACKGQGDVLTGALIERSRTKGCNQCGGTGYTTKMPPPAPVTAYVPQPPPPLPGNMQPPMIPGVPPPPTPTWDGRAWQLPT